MCEARCRRLDKQYRQPVFCVAEAPNGSLHWGVPAGYLTFVKWFIMPSGGPVRDPSSATVNCVVWFCAGDRYLLAALRVGAGRGEGSNDDSGFAAGFELDLHHSIAVLIVVTLYTAATHCAETHQSDGRSRNSISNAGFHCSLQSERRGVISENVLK